MSNAMGFRQSFKREMAIVAGSTVCFDIWPRVTFEAYKHCRVVLDLGSQHGQGLSSCGYRLCLVDRCRELRELVADCIDPTGQDVVFVRCDVSL